MKKTEDRTMLGPIDLVMWTKNGASSLPLVLKKISQVIPDRAVNKRVIIDDGSTDNTLSIARSHGWSTLANEGTGISDGANTALKEVESDYFASFEQDLVLADDWWQKIPRHFSNPRVAVASGVRLPNQPEVVRKIQEYSLERYEKRSSEPEAFLYGKTLDNTIYKTEVVRSLGGFPKTAASAGVDNILAKRVSNHGFEWKVDYSVKSTHLRKSVREEVGHDYWYGTCFSTLNPLLFGRNVDIKPMTVRVFLSPLRGLEIAVKKHAAQAVYVYPLMRFATLKGIADGLRRSQCT